MAGRGSHSRSYSALFVPCPLRIIPASKAGIFLDMRPLRLSAKRSLWDNLPGHIHGFKGENMSDTSNDKLLGFIPKVRYTYFTYMLVLSGVGLGALSTLLIMVGIYTPLGNIATLLGLAGIVLALLGAFLYKDDFSALDRSHFIYVAIVYAATWLAAVFFGSALYFFPPLAMVVMLTLALIAAVLVYTGYTSWQGGRTITKDNLKDEVKIALRRP